MKEEEMYRDCLEQQAISWLEPDKEIYLRKLIRKDIRQWIKMEREAEYKGETTDSEFASDEENMDRRIEDKVMFGSDSERDIDEFVIKKFKSQIDSGELVYAATSESESESETESSGDEEEGEEESEFEFDQNKTGKNSKIVFADD